jgi:short-subunit dehydrogenase
MVARGRGQIVLMGSLAGFVALPQSPVYSATKAAVHTYGEGLRRRLAASGVAVSVVAPGFVDTPMSASLETPRVFLWTAERAAVHIARGIDKRRRMLIFPWQLWLAIAAARLLPTSVIDRVLAAPQFGGQP